VTKYTKDSPIPGTLGAAVDRLFTTRQTRLEDTKIIDGMKAYETAIKDHLIAELPKDDASGVTGLLARAQISTKKVPSVKDWPAFFEYVKENDAWDLLARRVNDTAVAERWDNGETIPGVDAFVLTSVSITKL
jgi:hypothetical protein